LTPEQFDVAAQEEKKRRHDVMAHVHTFGTVAPAAAGIIQYVLSMLYFSSSFFKIFLQFGSDLLLRHRVRSHHVPDLHISRLSILSIAMPI